MPERTKIAIWRPATLGAAALLVALWFLTPSDAIFKQANTWQRMSSPGQLSAAHASLEGDCRVCHTPAKGVEPLNCIVCHANDETLLQSQVTSFHAHVGSCKDCHLEHQGRNRRPTDMDHAVLAGLGLRQLRNADPQSEAELVRRQFLLWLRQVDDATLPHPRVTPEALILNCATCHSNEDPHVGYFGDDCAACHSTVNWTLPEYVHPSATSTDCAQCHKAPPSHYMPMFMSMCATMLGKSPKSVKECYVCHTISAWNEMKGAPWHKKTMSHIPSR